MPSLLRTVGCWLALATGAVAAAGPIKGFVLTSYTPNGYDSDASDRSLTEMRALGVESVAIMFTWYMASITVTDILPDPLRTPTDTSIVRAIKKAQSLGMSVAYKPHIDLADDSWRAAIGLAYTTEAQWTAFFASYTAFLLHYADIAVANGVTLYNLGTEMESTHGREADWRAMIAAVRARMPPGSKLWLTPNYEAYVLPLPGYWLVRSPLSLQRGCGVTLQTTSFSHYFGEGTNIGPVHTSTGIVYRPHLVSPGGLSEHYLARAPVHPYPFHRFVAFWDVLDYLAVDMYQALGLKDDPEMNVTNIGWDIAKSGLVQFWNQTGANKT